MKCGKALGFEKIITPDGKAYHIHHFDGKKRTKYGDFLGDSAVDSELYSKDEIKTITESLTSQERKDLEET